MTVPPDARADARRGSLVTIVIPTYNGAPFLEAAIRSALLQSHGDTEVIVVDDASSDESLAIARRMNVRTIAMGTNCGEAVARNTGLAAAAGDFVTFMDQDDVLHPDHVRHLLRVIDDSAALAVAPSSVEFLGDEPEWESQPAPLAGTTADGSFDTVNAAEAVKGGVSNTILASRETLIAAGGFTPLLPGTGDYLLICTLARMGLVVKARRPTYGYRHHTAMSSNSLHMARNVLLCRAALAGPPQVRSTAPAWDTHLLADFARTPRSGWSRTDRLLDAVALARLVRLPNLDLLRALRRVVRREHQAIKSR